MCNGHYSIQMYNVSVFTYQIVVFHYILFGYISIYLSDKYWCITIPWVFQLLGGDFLLLLIMVVSKLMPSSALCILYVDNRIEKQEYVLVLFSLSHMFIYIHTYMVIIISLLFLFKLVLQWNNMIQLLTDLQHRTYC